MAQAEAHKELGRRALQAMAGAQGITDFAPWDLYAPPPAAYRAQMAYALITVCWCRGFFYFC